MRKPPVTSLHNVERTGETIERSFALFKTLRRMYAQIGGEVYSNP